jgi:hypothetical protein
MISIRFPAAAAVFAAMALAGCGSSGSQATTTLANLLAFNSPRAPAIPAQSAEPESDEYCPTVDIAPDGAATRSFAGAPSNQSLRHQVSITDVARQCTSVPGGGYVLKVGVEARVLIGPAGGAGAYSAPLRVVVKRGEQVVATRQRTVSGSVPAGQTGTTVAVVEEGINVPPGDAEVKVEVGLGGGGAAPERPRRRR